MTIAKTARAIAPETAIASPRGSVFRVASLPVQRGAPDTVDIPLRVAVVKGGITETTIATKAYTTTVQMSEAGSVPFTLVADDLVYPTPASKDADSYNLLYRLRSTGAGAGAEAAGGEAEEIEIRRLNGSMKNRRDRLAPVFLIYRRLVYRFFERKPVPDLIRGMDTGLREENTSK